MNTSHDTSIQKLKYPLQPSSSPQYSCSPTHESSMDDISMELADIVKSTDMMIQTKTFDLTITRAEYCSSTQSSQSTPDSILRTIDDDDMPTLDLLLSFYAMDQDIIFQNNGYKKIDKICDTLQGELFKAIKIDTMSTENPHYVAIKKTDKVLFKQRIAIQDDINFCVSEDIIKEALILKYLTVDNTPIGDYIVKYIDFFESDTNYYLVMEYISSTTNLRDFVSICHEYIGNGKLSIKEYNKMIRYLLWQLFVTIQWLHISMHCCHLDICMENIMITNATFIQTKNGLCIDRNISIKLCDLGVSEVFNPRNSSNSKSKQCTLFLCEKYGLSLDNELYSAPKIFEGDIYDARCADNWSLGMILFECITGKPLYGAIDINTNSIQSGYWALHNDKLKEYLKQKNLLKCFNHNTFDLLNGLLNVNEEKRFYGMDILRHKWFKQYYKSYKHQISKKFKQSNKTKMRRYKNFPFYH